MNQLWRLLLPGMNVPACGVPEGEPVNTGEEDASRAISPELDARNKVSKP